MARGSEREVCVATKLTPLGGLHCQRVYGAAAECFGGTDRVADVAPRFGLFVLGLDWDAWPACDLVAARAVECFDVGDRVADV